ncbi:MFS transporter [Castellaniella sp.]|uniref:MFS transporter n=1 Tax=Castellaniella sp. TaxID=1955812 RepID=UPI002AFE1860|nr:MFS transporter [Castellaniella sp.]
MAIDAQRPAGDGAGSPPASGRALRFVVLIGIVSLFGDATYEGSRAIWGPFFGTLGATGTVVGIVSGCGELAGYALRLFTGALADRTRRYWTITIAGYAVNLLAVPALALAGTWPVAAALVVTERIGKAIRTPSRDAMLSFAAEDVGGAGWAFGLHEALDQTGATVGPLFAAWMLFRQGSYHSAFAWLLLPALGAFATLWAARRQFPAPRALAAGRAPSRGGTASLRELRIFAVATALIAAGYSDFALIAFHLARAQVMRPAAVPVLYGLASFTAGASALALGRWFDRKGYSVLLWSTLAAAGYAPLVFLGGPWAATAGMALWGVGFGAHDSLFRAAVAQCVPAGRRATVLGLFNALYGTAWCVGSVVLGMLYDVNPACTVVVSLILQLAACPLLWRLRRP